MKIQTKEGSFFVNLPSKLYNKIVMLNQLDSKINLSILAYLLHLIITNKFNDKNKENGSEWTPLCSSVLRKFNSKGFIVSKHLDFLIKHNVLESKPYLNNIKGRANQCRRFKISNNYFEKEVNNSSVADSISILSEYKFKNKPLVKKIKKHHIQRKLFAEYKTNHLTKWLNSSGFKIDQQAANDYINKKYAGIKKRDMKMKREIAINEFECLNNKYSRSGKDNRLHSYFTTFPSDLKKFVTYNNQRLKEADIKSCQPFILTIILNIIKQEYYLELKKYNKISLNRFSNKLYKILNSKINTYNDEEYKLDIRRICYNITIMLQDTSRPIDFTEINSFISLIRNGDIYTFIGDHLLSIGTIWQKRNKYYVKLFDKDKGYIRTFNFDFLRDCSKKITINALYASTKKSEVDALKKFRALFPEVIRFLDVMKQNDKSELPILMQRMESKCILDYCSKKIAEKYPEMLLITRHDSLVTTDKDFKIMKVEFQYLLNEYFKTEVKLGEELWT